MMHSTLHFTVGLAAGTMGFLPALLRDWSARRSLSRTFAGWLLTSWGLAVLAVVPNLLRNLAAPEYICSGWWMNIFLFHPLLDKIRAGGMLIGEIGMISCFALQYVLLLAALRKRLATPDLTGQTSRSHDTGD